MRSPNSTPKRARAVRGALLLLAASLLSRGPAAAEPPSVESGFQAGKAFQFGDIDSVNLFNGNLGLTIPLGPRLPVGADFSWGLNLVYNSEPWTYSSRELQDGTERTRTQAHPDVKNAGLGWQILLGSLADPPSGVLPSFLDPVWTTYRSPDGAVHLFYRTLHDGDNNAHDDVAYTRDGTYLRLRRFADNHRELEFPDGKIHKFNSAGQLTRMTDHFGANTVDVTYSANLWTLVDAHARRVCVAFSGGLVRHLLVPSSSRWPSPEECTNAAAYTGARYSLTYTTRDLTRAWPADEEEPSEGGKIAPNVALLSRVTLPDGSSYDMGGANDYHVGLPWGLGSASEGLLRRIRLATGGFMEWDWGTYKFPGLTNRPWWDNSQGVVARRTRDANNALFGQWTYAPEVTPIAQTSPPNWKEMINTVTDPLGHVTKNYFSVNRLQSPNDVQEYGLPFSREQVPSDGKFLSTEVFEKPAGGGALVKVRSTYVRYEGDVILQNGDFETQTNRNRRAAASRTVYHDDLIPSVNAIAVEDSDSSDFDGLGHYRRTITSSNFPSSDSRNTWTNFNPGVGRYEVDLDGNLVSSFTMLSSSAPWVLGNYPESRVTEAGVTFAQHFCFDPNNGFLRRKRILKSTALNPSPGANDQIVIYSGSPVGNGFFIKEEHFGGDNAALSTASDLCNLPLAGPTYTLNRTQAYGLQTSVQFGGANFFTMRRTIDWHLGQPSASFDSADVQTNYEYDLMGRLSWVKPQSGSDAWTEYSFVLATSGQGPKLIVRQRPNGSPTGELVRTEYRYDGLGRLSQELFRRGGQDDVITHTYNAAGHKALESERGGGLIGTQYLRYDPFGRPGLIRRADQSENEITYFGDRVAVTERNIATFEAPDGTPVESSSLKTERYDHQGRLFKVIEASNPLNPGGSNTFTTYSYDPADHLTRVEQEAGGITQVRQFGYDGLGNLRWENHPEKTSNSYEPGVGYLTGSAVDYVGYDAMGKVGRTVDGPNELVYSYDSAGRLLTLSQARGSLGAINPARLVKELTYGAGTAAANRSKGKVSMGRRYNYPFLDGAYRTILMTTNYTYGGRAGRLSQRDLAMTFNGATNESFTQQWAHDDLGEVSTLTYPRCTFSPCQNVPGQSSPRVVTFQRADGLLTSVNGYATIGYHPNLMIQQVAFNDGTTWTQSIDPASKMPRPTMIQISSGGTLGPYQYDRSGNLVKVGTETYLYDLSGRLVLGRLGNGTYQQYTYDGFGNIQSLLSSSGPFSRNTPTNSATNRLQGGTYYDAAGNLTYWNGSNYEYDALNRMNRMISSGQEWHYMYDADDERVWTYRAGLPRFDRWTLRDLDSKVLRTYEATDWVWNAPVTDHVYRGDQLLATEWGANGGRKNALLDHLGTPRLIRSTTGIVTQHHYLPFGEEAVGNVDGERLKFTGHERDANNTAGVGDDLDYMHARFYNPLLGRFTSIDPVQGSLKVPQSWNRYTYAQNNPMRWVDPDGMAPQEPYESEVQSRASAEIKAIGEAAQKKIDAAGKAVVKIFSGSGDKGNLMENMVDYTFVSGPQAKIKEAALIAIGSAVGGVAGLVSDVIVAPARLSGTVEKRVAELTDSKTDEAGWFPLTRAAIRKLKAGLQNAHHGGDTHHEESKEKH